MLLKSADSKEAQITDLKRRIATAQGGYRTKLERDLRILQAGIKAEKDAAYLIDFDYEKSKNWAIIHDLRLEVGGRVAQIDHLLINRILEVYVLETKSFHSALEITDEGEFLRWNDFDKRYEGMPSPLAQNERHIAVLRDAFKDIKLPSKLGFTLVPTFQSFVLISPNAKIDRPTNFNASSVIKADALKATIDKQIDSMNFLGAVNTVAKLIDEGTLYAIARRLVGLHTPRHGEPSPDELVVNIASTVSTSAPNVAVSATATASPIRGTGPLAQAVAADPARPPSCKSCGKGAGNILYGQYGYYFKCSECGANTSMKWNCGNAGHSPRVRKDGRDFYRECQGCGLSSLFHRNSEG